MTNKLKTIIDAEFEVLTPLHISGGNIYQPSDVVRDDELFYVIDENKLIKKFNDNQKTLDELESPRIILQNFFNDHQELYVDDFIKYEIEARTRRSARFGSPLNDFARNKTDCSPYIPGSSVKGAFLSGIFWGLNQQARGNKTSWTSNIFEDALQRSANRGFEGNFSDNEFLTSILGRDSNKFIQKGFEIPDIKLKHEDLGVFAYALFHCDNPDGSNYSWSGFRKEHTTDLKLVNFNLIEAIKPGTVIPLKIQIDERTLKNFQLGELGSKIIQNNDFDFSDLIGSTFELAYNLLHFENEFFAKTGHRQLMHSSEELLNLATDIANSQRNNEILMRFGWGISYHGITGFLWKAETARKLNISNPKYARFPYPKSRKIIFDGQNELGTPGWVKLKIKL